MDCPFTKIQSNIAIWQYIAIPSNTICNKPLTHIVSPLVCMYVCMLYVCMYVCMYVCVYLCMYVYVYMYVHMYSLCDNLNIVLT